uniref:Uncharacterized protein n=1 Tax=Setaria italica TaxID=4555 RepID=K4ANV7_SETIT
MNRQSITNLMSQIKSSPFPPTVLRIVFINKFCFFI